MSAAVELHLLGPVEVTVEGESISLTRLRTRQVFALLGAFGGAPLTTDELVEQLFGDDRPKHPRKGVQIAVSRARRALGAAGPAIERAGDGYRLADGVRTDLAAFDQLVSRAGDEAPAEAITTLEAALALRRGAPFCGAAGPPMLEELASAIEVRRLAAEATLVASLVTAGEPSRAIAVAEPLLDIDPAWEQVAADAARALIAQGRRREALATLERVRTELRDSFGMQPSAALIELESTVLNDGVDLAPSRPAVVARGPFVGRHRELARLEAAVASGAPVVVVGEPGIGKSSLLRQLADRADRPCVRVEVDLEPTRPLALLADLAEGLLAEGAALADGGSQRTALGRVVPGLEATAGGLSRDELADALASWVVDALAAIDVLVVVDDLHLVDPFTAEVLGKIIAAEPGGLVAAARPIDDPLVRSMLGERGEVRELPLRPFSTAAVAEYVSEREVRGGDELVAVLHERSGGNPLFLSLLVDLQIEGALSGEALPTSLRVAVHDRLSGLADRVVRTLQTAAAMGQRFSVASLELVAPTALADLRAAQEAGLVVVDGNDAAFAHGLVAETCYEMMPPGRAVAVHDQIGTALHAAGLPAPDYASHFIAAAGLDPGRAVAASCAAGDVFAEGGDVEKALAHLGAGLDLVETHHLSNARRADLRLRIGRTQRVYGVLGHVEMLLGAIADAEAIGDVDKVAEGLIEVVSHGGTTRSGPADLDLLAAIDRALDQPLPPGLRAELLAATGTLVALSAEAELGRVRFREALSIVADLDDPDVERRVLSRAHLGLVHPDDLDERVHVAARLEELAGDEPDLRWEAAYLAFWNAFVAADGPALTARLDQMRRLRPTAAHRRVSMRHLETAYRHVRGDLAGAEEALETAYAEAREIFPESWARAHYGGLLYGIRKSQGRLVELSDMIDSFATPDFPNWQVGVAEIALERGELEKAGAILERVVADDFAALTTDLTWSVAMSGIGEIAAACGSDDVCRTVYGRLLPYAGRLSWAGTTTFGPIDGALAVLADRLGELDTAARHRADAEAMMASVSA